MKAIGRNPTGERLARIKQVNNYRDGSFQNIEPTEVIIKDASYLRMFKDFFNRPKSTRPSKPIPVVKTDLSSLIAPSALVVWFGHSSYLIKSHALTIVVDPVFSGYASPVKIFGKAFDGTGAYTTNDLPEIDVLLLTHDHYDHLDYKTIMELKARVKLFIVSLGVGEHLEYWGVESSKIIELNWGDHFKINDEAHITACPARHFSGRSLKRAQTLWSSFVLQLNGKKIFLGGDSGYDQQFKIIGAAHGPFDLALLDCAQYGLQWPSIHMKPEETVQAAIDLQAKILMPVHWGKFLLSNHPWTEPVERVLVAASKHNLAITTPMIGEPYVIGDKVKKNRWWDFEKEINSYHNG